MEPELTRIAEPTKGQAKPRLTSLIHLINAEMLKACHAELKGNKAVGVDKVTKEEYGQNLDANIEDLLGRMKRWAYRPLPVRRTYIPKAGTDKMRPLGILAYEDKLVQMAVSKILNGIYEEEFLDNSFGFRPGRGQHDALKLLDWLIANKPVNYIVDADIKGFFDNVDHDWVMKFLGHRIADTNLLRLIKRFLIAGIMEDGQLQKSEVGVPQGGNISPILSNIYLHYALDLWFEKVVRKRCKGAAYIVRFADDFACCFEYKEDAEAFLGLLTERLAEFKLEVAVEKTKILAFGRRAHAEARREGKTTHGTFDFLGFTHYCSKSRHGRFRAKRQTSKKKLRAKLAEFTEWIKKNRHMPMHEIMKMVESKLRGHYLYYGITDNYQAMNRYKRAVIRLLFKWLNLRSQKRSYTWEQFNKIIERFKLPNPKVMITIWELRLPSLYIP
ncbi:DNA polymerase [Clostridiales bacterium PH28_bin88]|nr:DNA polymerase [Clostridiales bacterium PH28_bin88]